MIIGITGKAGSGKDTVADLLVKDFSFVKVALADELKRICMRVFNFSIEQLFGPSEKRNEPDKRYPRDDKFIYPAAPAGALWLPIGGGRTLINEVDLDRILQFKWCVNEKEKGKRTNYVRTPDGSLKLHQLLMGPAPEGKVIDHINGDGMDNRQENLRFCTHSENHANEGKRRGGSSVFKGVGFDKERNKWYAKLTTDGETLNMGRFDSEVEAAMAYDRAAVDVFGSFARTNSKMFLTPRYALQQLGTNWGRDCYANVWVDFAMRVAEKLEMRISIGDRLHDPQGYIQHEGLVPLNEYPLLMETINGVVVPDCRFKNEFDAIRAKGGKLLRIKRTAAARFVAGADGVQEKMSHEKWELQGNAALHRSETEQDEVPDEYFDFVINNDGDLAELRLQVSHVMKTLKGEIEGEARADDFASALTNMSKDTDAILTSRKMEDIPGVLESEDVEIKFEPTGALKDMLKRREEDIKSGRLMEYDADQADVPPFMRKRKK